MASTATDSTPSSTASELLSKASAVISTKPSEAERLYKQVLSDAADESSSTGPNEQSLRDQETALLRLGELYRDQMNAKGLAEIITASRTFMSSTAKAKTAKLIRTLLTYFNSIPNSLDLLLTTLQSNIAFAKEHKRLFLKHSLEARLAALYLENSRFKDALGILEGLGKELRRLDDKLVLAECFLLESRTYWGFGNLAKSKASLTSARTAGNAIYCPPYLQAQLDMQSGVLHAEDKDWGTAYSYFFEAFENLGNLGTSVGGEEKEALSALNQKISQPFSHTNLLHHTLHPVK
ncbi:hypothetical protein H0H93_014039 [Arthromyces matolae]|nr:hypothetical protein H0H93_014039 [Arthromyces matolae]